MQEMCLGDIKSAKKIILPSSALPTEANSHVHMERNLSASAVPRPNRCKLYCLYWAPERVSSKVLS